MHQAGSPSAGPASAEAVTSSGPALLHVLIGGARYAIALSNITELLRVPPVAPVPLGPACLIGLMNRRGAALPLVDTAVLLHGEACMRTAAARVLVGNGLGFLVDGVAGTTGARLDGPGQAPVPVLDLAHLASISLPETAMPARRTAGIGQSARCDSHPSGADDTRALLGFTVAGQACAFALEAVEGVARIGMDDAAAGTAVWRGTAIPLLCLAAMFGGPAAEGGCGSHAQFAVVRMPDGPATGIVVDRFSGILRVPTRQYHAVPPLLARGRIRGVEAICRLDGGARLVCVLSLQALLGEGTAAPRPQAARAAQAAAGAGTRQRFIVYRVGTARFAAPMSGIDEVLRAGALAAMPGGPPAVAGISHYRGTVLPVIDVRRRFGLPGGTPGRNILVQAAGGGGAPIAAGFMVDAVEGVLAVAAGGIAEPPALPGHAAGLVTHILSPPGEGPPLPVLHLPCLLDSEGAGSLAALLDQLRAAVVAAAPAPGEAVA